MAVTVTSLSDKVSPRACDSMPGIADAASATRHDVIKVILFFMPAKVVQAEYNGKKNLFFLAL
jgi:hypothetical protein